MINVAKLDAMETLVIKDETIEPIVETVTTKTGILVEIAHEVTIETNTLQVTRVRIVMTAKEVIGTTATETIVIEATEIVVETTGSPMTRRAPDKRTTCPSSAQSSPQVPARAVVLERREAQAAPEAEAVAAGVEAEAGVEVAVKVVSCNTTCKKTPPKAN